MNDKLLKSTLFVVTVLLGATIIGIGMYFLFGGGSHVPTYIANGDGTYTFTGNAEFKTKDIITAEDVMGDCEGPVTIIGAGAFRGLEITSVIELPDTIKIIEANAFRDCPNLTAVTLKDGITTIRDHAFRNSPSLREVIIPDTVTELGNFTFRDCEGLVEVVLSENLTTIGVEVFMNCTSLGTDIAPVIIPANISQINARAFKGCTSLEQIFLKRQYLQGGVHITSDTFDGCDMANIEIFIPFENFSTFMSNFYGNQTESPEWYPYRFRFAPEPA